ncbi:MAG: ACP S-malonyltransferase [Bacteroidota bacterium]
MKTALVFPGQGAQAPGMGQDLYQASAEAKAMFDAANGILGFDIVDTMFNGSAEDLTQTSVTQPAIYIHSVALAAVTEIEGEMVAGHSLGEFSALAAAGVLDYADGLKLVSIRANAMQKACDAAPSTMAAIIGLENDIVEQICAEIDDIVVPANYNSPGQIVISGSISGIDAAVAQAKAAGAKLAKILSVNGAFHSPLMQPAAQELEAGIRAAAFNVPRVPVYQNVTAVAETDPARIQDNLVAQLTAPVRWTQTVEQMITDGAERFVELGPGNVLQGLIKRINRKTVREGKQTI